MTDFRALCAELADSVELLLEMRAVDAKPMAITEDRLSRARAALAQPEPTAPTDEELEKLADDYMAMDGATGVMCLGHLDFARAALTRWGRPANNISEESFDA